MRIFVINAGSSSLKYQLFDMDTEDVLASGQCDRIKIGGHMKHTPRVGNAEAFNEDIDLPNHAAAIKAVLNIMTSEKHGVIKSMDEISAVGHRVVHGGESFNSSVLLTDEVMQAIEECIPLAPLHNPANIDGIVACREVMGDVPMVGVFDTAFHQTMSQKAYTYAIPKKYYTDYKIRRYGFHGTSHRYVAAKAAELLGKPIEETKIITCHLGNGSSIAAVMGGESIDTSMGFTPIAGVPMGTRCGDIDAGVLQYIMDHENLNMDEMMNVLNKESGVLGLSEVSSDFRDLYTASNDGNTDATLALDTFSYSIAKYIGSYAAAMNGVDAVVFTAGIGENVPEIREKVAVYLEYLGAKLDDDANNTRGTTLISTPDSSLKLLVIPTNEELVIARDTRKIVDTL